MAESVIAKRKPKGKPLEIGAQFGRLTVIKEVDPHITPKGEKHRKAECRCVCGEIVNVIITALRTGATRSCGCLKQELEKEQFLTHGLSRHPLYLIWAEMKHRCGNTNSTNYVHYGGRGISVCREWVNNPVSFIKWAMSAGWKEGLQIDRRDNDDGYSPGNCRIVDRGLNSRNQRLLKSNNTSGYKGVSLHKPSKKWLAYITCNGKRYSLGHYSDPVEAAHIRDKKARELNAGHPLNFPDEAGRN